MSFETPLKNREKIALGLTESHLSPVQSNGHQQLLHSEILNDWQRLVASAKDDNIDLCIASGFRSFERQQMIWNNKANGLRPVKDANNQTINIASVTKTQLLKHILHWSALPGASRHHWGTDIDVFAPSMLSQPLQLEPWEYEQDGPMALLGQWLSENLTAHGFFLPYRRYNGGVAREPWHISHISQSQALTNTLSFDLLQQTIANHDIGLKAEVLASLDSIYIQYITNIEKHSL